MSPIPSHTNGNIQNPQAMTLSEAQPVAYAGSSPFTPVTGSLRAPPLVCCHCCFPDTCPQPAPPRPRKTPRAPRCSGPAWKPPLSPSDSRGWGRDLGVIPGPLQFAHSPPTAAERTRPGPVLRTGRRPPVRSPWRHRAERAETILPLAEPQRHLPGSVRSASPREGSGHCIEGNTSSTHN